MVGKEVKSSGRWRKSAVISTSTERVTESARPASSSGTGRGTTSTTMSMATPIASATSVEAPTTRSQGGIVIGGQPIWA